MIIRLEKRNGRIVAILTTSNEAEQTMFEETKKHMSPGQRMDYQGYDRYHQALVFHLNANEIIQPGKMYPMDDFERMHESISKLVIADPPDKESSSAISEMHTILFYHASFLFEEMRNDDKNLVLITDRAL